MLYNSKKKPNWKFFRNLYSKQELAACQVWVFTQLDKISRQKLSPYKVLSIAIKNHIVIQLIVIDFRIFVGDKFHDRVISPSR